MAHGKLVGVITLICSSGPRRYGLRDVRIAEELAQRAALSIENARLFSEVQRAVKIREDVLAVVSHDLKNPVATIETDSRIYFAALTRLMPTKSRNSPARFSVRPTKWIR